MGLSAYTHIHLSCCFFFILLLPSRHKLTHISVLFASGGTHSHIYINIYTPVRFDGGWDREHVGVIPCRLYQQHWPQDVLLCRSVIKARQPAHWPYITAHTLLIVGCKLCHLISLNFILARLTDVTVNDFFFSCSFCFDLLLYTYSTTCLCIPVFVGMYVCTYTTGSVDFCESFYWLPRYVVFIA